MTKTHDSEIAVGTRVRAVHFHLPDKAHGHPVDEQGLVRDADGQVITVDDNVTVPTGTEGLVTDVDDFGTLRVHWDNGHKLGLTTEDVYEALTRVPAHYNVDGQFCDRGGALAWGGQCPDGCDHADHYANDGHPGCEDTNGEPR
jgi:hypothetical protein